MILLIGNTKGGVGKTTLSINMVIARALAGRSVLLVDGDPQGTASTALQIRAEGGTSPVIACTAIAHGPTLRTQVLAQLDKWDDIVIDAGGRDSGALRAALTLADVLLCPFQPRSLDVWALSDIAELVDEARSVRDGLRALAVVNCADPSGSDNRDAAEAAKELPQFELLPTPLVRRKAFAEAAGRGLSVLESTPVDLKARAELTALYEQVFK